MIKLRIIKKRGFKKGKKIAKTTVTTTTVVKKIDALKNCNVHSLHSCLGSYLSLERVRLLERFLVRDKIFLWSTVDSWNKKYDSKYPRTEIIIVGIKKGGHWAV